MLVTAMTAVMERPCQHADQGAFLVCSLWYIRLAGMTRETAVTKLAAEPTPAVELLVRNK